MKDLQEPPVVRLGRWPGAYTVFGRTYARRALREAAALAGTLTRFRAEAGARQAQPQSSDWAGRFNQGSRGGAVGRLRAWQPAPSRRRTVRPTARTLSPLTSPNPPSTGASTRTGCSGKPLSDVETAVISPNWSTSTRKSLHLGLHWRLPPRGCLERAQRQPTSIRVQGRAY